MMLIFMNYPLCVVNGRAILASAGGRTQNPPGRWVISLKDRARRADYWH
jgi:hypothetical protein